MKIWESKDSPSQVCSAQRQVHIQSATSDLISSIQRGRVLCSFLCSALYLLMIDFTLLKLLHSRCVHRVKYLLGAKAPSLDCESKVLKVIDCSGYVRWLVYRIMGLTLPDGSQNQLAWARKHLRKLASYSDVAYAKDDPNRIFICFYTPTPEQEQLNAETGHAHGRHVWLETLGETIESCGSKGVCSQDYRVRSACHEAYELVA